MSMLKRQVKIGGKVYDLNRVLISEKPSRTDPRYAADADINVIVARFAKTRVLPSSVSSLTFGDFTQMPIGTDALMAVRNANQAFEALPLVLRRELEHDFTRFEPWLRDPENFDRAVKLGILKPRASQGGSPPLTGGPSGPKEGVQPDPGQGTPPEASKKAQKGGSE